MTATTLVTGADTGHGDKGGPRRDTAQPRRPRYRLQALIITLGLAATIVISISAVHLGTANATVADVLGAIWSKLTGTTPEDSAAAQLQTVIWELRVPRVILAILAGTALAIAGTLFQGLLRNPLVSPYTLGIAPAAAFGASVSIIVFGASGTGVTLIAGALIAASVNTILILSLASSKGLEPTTLILLGIALTQLFNALTAGLQYFAEDETLARIVRWTWGSVNSALWYQVLILLVVVALAYPLIQLRSGSINAIAFAGDDAAKSLGVPVKRVRLESIIVGVVLTATTISFTGIIGFVGLVGPHIARLIIGANHRFLIPFAAVIGASLMVIADLVGRTVISPGVIPVGIVDALIGAPIFIYLILSKRRA